MEYKLTINNKTVSLTARKEENDNYRVTLDGRECLVAWKRISDRRISLSVDGKNSSIYIDDNGGGKTVFFNGIPYLVEKAGDPGARRASGRSRESDGKITPPMPSVVVKIMAARGAHVEKGEGLIVVSAMKLETTLSSPWSGTVKSVNAGIGDKVMPGQVLVDIEKDTNPEG